jgi:hypothetical protein
MKKQVLLFFMLSFLGGSLMTSCSSDDETVSHQTEALGIKPAKAPEFSISSNGYDLASSRAGLTRAVVTSVGTFSYYKVQDNNIPDTYKSAIPAAVTDNEKTYVKEYIKEHPDEASVAFYNINYFVQYAGSSYDTYTATDQNNATQYITGSNHMDQIEINGQKLNDYNSSYGPDALCLNLPLTNPAYHDSYGDVDQTKYDAYKIYKITYNDKVGYYLGFDYKTKKNDGEEVDGDGVYNDYVIKLTPADDTTYGNGTTPGTASTNGGEVEVNLSVNAEKSEGDYIATKLSIHVRDTTDVEVYIPAPAEYYCAADDMSIVLSHQDDAEKYNDTANKTTMTYTVDGQDITLSVAYELAGIRVTTSGINATVLKYLHKTYSDGLTFEVWNYYKNSVTIDGTTSDVTRGFLKNQFLENSTVKFTEGTGRYINAFGAIKDYTGTIYDKVDPTTGVRTPYTDEGLTQELDQQYWDRSTTDPRYYVLHTTVNAWDCKVLPTDNSYTLQATDVYNQIYQK